MKLLLIIICEIIIINAAVAKRHRIQCNGPDDEKCVNLINNLKLFNQQLQELTIKLNSLFTEEHTTNILPDSNSRMGEFPVVRSK